MEAGESLKEYWIINVEYAAAGLEGSMIHRFIALSNHKLGRSLADST